MSTSIRIWLGVATCVLMVAAMFMVFVYVPTEADQGIVQRIFYFHVPCAWVAFAAFALVARFAAVVGIAAALDVPIIIVSVRLWRTIHPAVLVTRQGGHGLEDPRMVATLMVSMAAFTALFVWLLCLRFATLRTQTRLNQVARELGFAHAAAGDL